jgi:hypothetical protein
MFTAAMLRLAQLLSQPDDWEFVVVAGDTWRLQLEPIDLRALIVTVQRGDNLLAAVQPRHDGRLPGAAGLLQT